jgi:hypothetical protein
MTIIFFISASGSAAVDRFDNERAKTMITFEMFKKDLIEFRRICGDRSYSMADMELAWKGLTFVYVGATASYRAQETTDEEIRIMDAMYQMQFHEFSQRKAMMIRMLRFCNKTGGKESHG